MKTMITWKHASMLLVVAASVFIFIRSLQKDDELSVYFALFAVIVPVVVWIFDTIENKKQQKRFEEFEKEVKDYGFDVIDNPEWLSVTLDKEQHILFGIKRDGSVEWSIGVPGPIKTELDALKKRVTDLEKEKNYASGAGTKL